MASIKTLLARSMIYAMTLPKYNIPSAWPLNLLHLAALYNYAAKRNFSGHSVSAHEPPGEFVRVVIDPFMQLSVFEDITQH
jgi:hypothetical protein